MAGDLIKNLKQQIAPFRPGYTLGESAVSIEKIENEQFIVTTDQGTQHQASVIAIAGGLGTFEPRKPPLENLEQYENNGVNYIIKNPEYYRDKNVIIAGGGDSALDWTIFLENIASSVTLVHRRKEFRGSLDSVDKVQQLKNQGRINLITEAEVIGLKGVNRLDSVTLSHKEAIINLECDYFIPLFGMTPKLGPIANWGLDIKKNAIKVDNSLDYQTNIPGIYAIGDVNIYPGKLKLILCGFHEATLMCQSAFQRIYPDKRNVLKYTTVTGINGFDGSKKQALKSTIKSIL
jgi:thioredoxin reductase (NADPH)